MSLRQELVKYLANARGIHTDPDHIIITNGVQEGLALVARTLLTPQEHIAVESPAIPAHGICSVAVHHTGTPFPLMTLVYKQSAYQISNARSPM